MTTTKAITKFLADYEEKTYQEFMDSAGLGEEYKSAKFIPQIKDVLERFAEKGYRIESKELLNTVDMQILAWRTSLFLNDDEIVCRDINITIQTIKKI